MKEYKKLIVTKKGKVYQKTLREIPQHREKNGYMRLSNTDFVDGDRSVHRIVAKAHIPNPENKPQVNHKDKDRANNHVSNLEWVTSQENQEHAIAKTWYFLSPRGVPYKIFNLTKFCRERGLNQGHMWSLNNGDVIRCKGWSNLSKKQYKELKKK